VLTKILGAWRRWLLADGLVFTRSLSGDIMNTVKEGPRAGRHAVQHTYYQRALRESTPRLDMMKAAGPRYHVVSGD
jgi:hypothetical protein